MSLQSPHWKFWVSILQDSTISVRCNLENFLTKHLICTYPQKKILFFDGNFGGQTCLESASWFVFGEIIKTYLFILEPSAFINLFDLCYSYISFFPLCSWVAFLGLWSGKFSLSFIWISLPSFIGRFQNKKKKGRFFALGDWYLLMMLGLDGSVMFCVLTPLHYTSSDLFLLHLFICVFFFPFNLMFCI